MEDEHTSTEKYPPLIQQLSGVISETDLEKVSRDDEKVRYILRDGRLDANKPTRQHVNL